MYRHKIPDDCPDYRSPQIAPCRYDTCDLPQRIRKTTTASANPGSDEQRIPCSKRHVSHSTLTTVRQNSSTNNLLTVNRQIKNILREIFLNLNGLIHLSHGMTLATNGQTHGRHVRTKPVITTLEHFTCGRPVHMKRSSSENCQKF